VGGGDTPKESQTSRPTNLQWDFGLEEGGKKKTSLKTYRSMGTKGRVNGYVGGEV